MTELGAPHRETAQAPLCRFGRGRSVRFFALGLGKVRERENAQDTGDVDRFGPLRSPGMNLAGTDVPTAGVSTPAPARDEFQEALIIPTGRGEACDRPPVAT
uniref:DUF1263 domain-containing protein n=1 Tax=Oryza sativa subsp. japonica TaxID=39947 RepID=Q7EY10_ORYSJ|nr:hypothetical protein [Oryza sativa Japonica Group]BAC99900.1 hypothetical protein [Oryza sativa Japonica Group]